MVNTCITILNLLHENDLYVSRIIEQTSSDKNHVIQSLALLERGELITTRRSPDHKQKRIKKLSEFGIEVADIIHNVEQYNQCYYKLKKLQLKKEEAASDSTLLLLLGQKENLRGYLRKTGWNEEQITFYENSHASLDMVLEFYFEREIINILLYRYALLIYRYGSKVGEISRAIINKLIIETINLRITTMFNTIEVHSYDTNNYKQEDEAFIQFTREYLAELNAIPSIHGAQVMTDIKELVYPYLGLIEPTTDIINNYIEKLKKSIEKFGSTDKKRNLNQTKIAGSRYLADIYENYKSKLS